MKSGFPTKNSIKIFFAIAVFSLVLAYLFIPFGQGFNPSPQLFTANPDGTLYLPASTSGSSSSCSGSTCQIVSCDPDHATCTSSCSSDADCAPPPPSCTETWGSCGSCADSRYQQHTHTDCTVECHPTDYCIWNQCGAQTPGVCGQQGAGNGRADECSPLGASCGVTSPICGNGVVESGEQCDNGTSNGPCPATCSTSCTTNSCGTTGTNTVRIRATLNGSQISTSVIADATWPGGGATNFTLNIPQDISGVPVGTYSVTYKSGGPSGATLQRINPCAGTSCSQTLLSGGTITFTFEFVSTNYTLSVNSSPITGISITGSPSTYSGTTNYQKTGITSGTSLSLTAPATSGSYDFSIWSGCNSVGGTGNRTCNVTMNSNRTATANYTSFDFSLSNSGNKSVEQGKSVTNFITANLISGTTKSVSFSVSGIPFGASASLSPTFCNPTCTTTLTINTTSSTPTGSYTIRVTGTGGGLTRTTSFTLTVTAPPPRFSANFTATSGGSSGQNITINSGDTVVFSWGTQNTTSCVISDNDADSADIGSVPLSCNPPACSDSQDTVNPVKTTTYTLTCTGPGGSIRDRVIVNVSSVPEFIETAPEN